MPLPDVDSPTAPASSSAGYSGYGGLDSGLDSLAASANSKVGNMGYQDRAAAPASSKYVLTRLSALSLPRCSSSLSFPHRSLLPRDAPFSRLLFPGGRSLSALS